MLDYRYNDGGRKEAGFRGSTGDCLVRAIAIATGLPYSEVYETAARLMKSNGYRASGNATIQTRGIRKPGMPSVRAVQDQIMEGFGFSKVKLPQGARPKYTQALQRYGPCIVSTNGHVAALKDGALQDTFDGRTYDYGDLSGERKARSAWVLKEETGEYALRWYELKKEMVKTANARKFVGMETGTPQMSGMTTLQKKRRRKGGTPGQLRLDFG